MRRRPSPTGFIEPCLPSNAPRPPAGDQWLHEVKQDGFRLMARRDAAGLRLLTRNGHDWTSRFPQIAAAVNALRCRSCLVDGEAVCCDDAGVAIFEWLRRRANGGTALLYAFDLLELDGRDLRHEARLRELGWTDEQTIALEYRWAEGRSERFPALAAELARLRPDLLVATSTAAALACKQATSVIPIVFPLAGDPLGTGLIASLSRPGANITGLSNQAADLAGKRLEILREVIPSLRHLAALANAEYPGRISEIGDIRNAAQALRIDVAAFEVRRAEEIAPVLDSAVTQGAEALYVVGDTVLNTHRVHIASLAVNARLPTMYVSRESVEAGGLMSYGANIPHLFSRAAEIVDKILRGAKAGDISVEQPTKFDLVINLKTAKAIGLEIPATLLVRADEVIE